MSNSEKLSNVAQLRLIAARGEYRAWASPHFVLRLPAALIGAKQNVDKPRGVICNCPRSFCVEGIDVFNFCSFVILKNFC